MILVFFALWVVFNGRFTWEIAAFGAILSGALYMFCRAFLGYSLRAEWAALKRVPAMLGYFCTLIGEIVKANIALTRVVFTRSSEVQPKLVTFRTPLRGKLARSVLADSITLTPGTITVTQEDDKLTVHCLDTSFAEDVDQLHFQKLLMTMEGKDANDD